MKCEREMKREGEGNGKMSYHHITSLGSEEKGR